MNIFNELERINFLRDLGDKVEIFTTTCSHIVPKIGLKFFITEEMQNPCFQNTGANTIWYSTWSQINDLLEENGISIPEEIIPCRTCNGSLCRFWCPKH